MSPRCSLLRSLQQPQATVEDAAEATLRLYDLAISLPNVSAEELEGLDWQPLGEELFDLMHLKPEGGGESGPGRQLPQGSEEGYESPQPVDFRGDFKPELVQLLMRLRLQEGMEVPDGLAPLTAEQLARADGEERRDHRRRAGGGRPVVCRRPLPDEPGEGGGHAYPATSTSK